MFKISKPRPTPYSWAPLPYIYIAAQQWSMFCRVPWHRRLNHHDHRDCNGMQSSEKCVITWSPSPYIGWPKKKFINPFSWPQRRWWVKPASGSPGEVCWPWGPGLRYSIRKSILQKKMIIQIWPICVSTSRRWVSNLCDLRWMQPTRMLAFWGTACMENMFMESSSLSGNGATWVFIEGAC